MRIYKSATKTGEAKINGTKLTVYHRTGKSGSDVLGNICNVGFIAGGGAAYGAGIYTTYSYESSLQNYNLRGYGAYVLKVEVDVNGFLIFDYDVAKQVYGDNYRLIDQIKNIIGIDKILNKSLQQSTLDSKLKTIEAISEALEHDIFTSNICSNFVHAYNLVENGVNGIVYTGHSDGNCCVAYKSYLMVPLEHAFIDGKTYKNPNWISCPQKSVEELRKLKDDEKAAGLFTENRMTLINDLKSNPKNITKDKYPNIPDGIFNQIISDYIYDDDARINNLSPALRQEMRGVIEQEHLIRKLKSAPTFYWEEWKNVSEDIRKKIPQSVIVDIWTNFLDRNKGHWDKIPQDVKPMIPKDFEAAYWKRVVSKNPFNWHYVPDDIIEEFKLENILDVPPNIAQMKAERELYEQGKKETEEVDVPVDMIRWVQEEISKLNNRAAKLGLPPIMLDIISEDRVNKTQRIKIVGNVPTIRGWRWFAKISLVKDDDGIETRRVAPLVDDAAPYLDGMETEALRCDECKENRKRNEYYIIQNTSTKQQKMIGTSCLGAYIDSLGGMGGRDPQAIAEYASLFKQMVQNFAEASKLTSQDNDKARLDFKKNGVPLSFFLSKVVQLLKSGPFRKAKGRNMGSMPLLLPSQERKINYHDAIDLQYSSTSKLAWQMCVNKDIDEQFSLYSLTPTDLSIIDNAVAWISTIPDPPESEDTKFNFLYNLKKACEGGSAKHEARRKKGQAERFSNVDAVSWLIPSFYRNVGSKNKINYLNLLGKKGDSIVFNGKIVMKKPMFLSIVQQSVLPPSTPATPPPATPTPAAPAGQPLSPAAPSNIVRNVHQNYCVVEDAQGKKIVFIDENKLSKSIDDSIKIKGQIDGYTFIGSESVTSLIEVIEIDDNTYNTDVKDTEEKTAKLHEEHKAEIDKEKPQVKPQDQAVATVAPYIDNSIIEDDFKIYGIQPARGGSIYYLNDSTGRKVSTITNLDLGKVNDTVKLKGTVFSGLNRSGNKFIALRNISIVGGKGGTQTQTPPPSQSPSSTPSAVPSAQTPYADNTPIEADFDILSKKQANYGNYLYVIRDLWGRQLSAFMPPYFGQVGDKLRLKGIIKIKGNYINLIKPVRVAVPLPQIGQSQVKTPTTSPVATSPVPPTAPTTPADSTALIPQSSVDDSFIRLASISWLDEDELSDNLDISENIGWYKKYKVASVLDKYSEATGEISAEEPIRKHKKPYEIDLDKAYEQFKGSYEKATGKAWGRGKFQDRAANWIFYGDDAQTGWITVRPQRSGLYKLVGMAGNPKAIIRAFDDLMSEGKPVWGMVSPEIQNMAVRKGMSSPPGWFIKLIMMKNIPKEIFGGAEIISVDWDGKVTLGYKDVGSTSKYFIGNDQYYAWLRGQFWDRIKRFLGRGWDKLTGGKDEIDTNSRG